MSSLTNDNNYNYYINDSKNYIYIDINFFVFIHDVMMYSWRRSCIYICLYIYISRRLWFCLFPIFSPHFFMWILIDVPWMATMMPMVRLTSFSTFKFLLKQSYFFAHVRNIFQLALVCLATNYFSTFSAVKVSAPKENWRHFLLRWWLLSRYVL